MQGNMHGEAQRAIGMPYKASLVRMGDLHHAGRDDQQRTQDRHGHAKAADLPRLWKKAHLSLTITRALAIPS